MELNCPDCRQTLRIADDLASRAIRCPRCGAIFQLAGGDLPPSLARPDRSRSREPIPKELYLAIDVSTSTRKSLPEIHAHLKASLAQIRQSGPFSLAIYLFHRHVMPFPSEALCRPLPFEQAVIPTLADLEQRVGAGTAILDAVDRLVDHALAEQAANPERVDRRVIVLTDGWERSSKLADAARLTAKLSRVRRQVDVSLTGFVDGRSYGCLVDLVRDLELPEESWAFARHRGDQESIHDSICDMSLELVKFAILPEPGRPSDSSYPAKKVGRSSAPPVWTENPSGFSSSDFHGVGAS
jgi:hypothetical protein